MSEHEAQEQEAAPMGIPDEALPEDLVAGEDNPLAEGLPAGETAEGLLEPDQDAVRKSQEAEDSDEPGAIQTGSAPQEQ
ncbi:hypothetical protein [Nocardioides ultimimeridianus]